MELNQVVNLIEGLKGVISQKSFDLIKNELSEVLQSHEMFKAYIVDYRSANINLAEEKLNMCVDYRDNTFYLIIAQFLHFLADFKKKEVAELNMKISDIKNEVSLDSAKKVA